MGPDRDLGSVLLYRTAPHPCSYKPGRQAATVFVDPEQVITRSLNSWANELGYRRSGAHIYRPECGACRACVSCRVPVEKFSPRRRHRRVWRANSDLRVTVRRELDRGDSWRLYRDYIDARHQDGDMHPATPEQFDAFVRTRTTDTRYVMFHEADALVAVSVTDRLRRGLSAVYTYYDPARAGRSLGVFAILWQIARCRELKLPWLFLGYWVEGSPKMQYKLDFRPMELLLDGRWTTAPSRPRAPAARVLRGPSVQRVLPIPP